MATELGRWIATPVSRGRTSWSRDAGPWAAVRLPETYCPRLCLPSSGPPIMRRDLSSRWTVASLLAALLVLSAGWLLHHGTRTPVEGRAAFAARIERGDRPMPASEIAAHWRSDLAVRQSYLERDRWLSRVLMGTGVVVLLAGLGARGDVRASLAQREATSAV